MVSGRAESDFRQQGGIDTLGLKQIFSIFSVDSTDPDGLPSTGLILGVACFSLTTANVWIFNQLFSSVENSKFFLQNITRSHATSLNLGRLRTRGQLKIQRRSSLYFTYECMVPLSHLLCLSLSKLSQN